MVQLKKMSKIDMSQLRLSSVVKSYAQHFPPPHPGMILDVSRDPNEFGIWTIYTYKDNTESFSEPQRESLWIWLKGMLDFLNKYVDRGAVQTEEVLTTPPNHKSKT